MRLPGYSRSSVNLPETDLVRLLCALLALLLASQLAGGLAQRLKQPRVIGEILGGMLFGPTVLGALAPAAYRELFAANPLHQQILGFVSWLGLLLLMFCSGMENQPVRSRQEWRTAGFLVGAGTLLPLALGLAAASLVDLSALHGPRATPTTFGLLLAMAVAVTSIPVISKIFFDLGLTGTPFARIVLSAALIEDLLLWVLLSITLDWAGAGDQGAWALGRGVVVTVVFFLFTTLAGHRIYDGISRARWNPFRTSPDAMPLLLVFLLGVLLAYLLGVNPIFGAFLAGRVVGNSARIAPETREQVTGFSFGLFIPVYFAIVGLRLDLHHDFDLAAFLGVLLFACTVKTAATWIGGRLAGHTSLQATHLAVAMNARGGPGIVLATVALDAQLINGGCYAILVLLSLVSSQLAGWWLGRAMRRRPKELALEPATA
ncbi:MAG: cation:proton antiporter [Candidatus Sericytochromatia bacterium]|nr:cation:proton antiporter [Candidatus Tanganyikabacteria bacterium]